MRKDGAPGVAVAVTKDGERAVFNYGLASKADATPVADDTLFEIGSVSKTFTATLAAYAAELGKLSLDDRPSRFAPELVGSDVDKATLLELGTYAAGGLPLQFPDEVRNDAQALDYLRAWTADAPPGAQRRYSNPSIGLLGHLTARALGGDFADRVETDLFSKLALKASRIRVRPADMPRYAWGYDKAGKPVRVNPGAFADEAYGVKATAADMISFVEANLSPDATPLGRAIAATHVARYRAGALVQGLGWEQTPYPVSLENLLAANSSSLARDAVPIDKTASSRAPRDATLFGKTGSTNGFGAYVAFIPELRIGVVILANRNVPIPARITAAHAVLESLRAVDR